MEGMDRVLALVGNWSTNYWWLIATVVAAYLYATYRYCRLTRGAGDAMRLAPISVKGGISNQLGAREAGLLLRAQLSSIVETFRQDRRGHASLYTAAAVGDRFRLISRALESAPLGLEITALSELKLKEELIVKVGAFQIPVGAIINLFVALLRVLPVPFRRRYMASLIHVSLVSVGDETQLLVHREGSRPASPERVPPHGDGQTGDGATVVAQTRTVTTLTDLADLLRETAFVVLEVHGKAFPGRRGRSMKYFADGLDGLDRYRRTASEQAMAEAKESFARAVAADADNCEALYFYGSMLLLDRTRESIATATQLFTRALKTDKVKLRALVNTGLAHCYAQGFHRLAKRDADVLAKASLHAEQARRDWVEAAGTEPLHPWILSSLALVQHVDEGTEETREDARKRFLGAAGLYLQAIAREPDNGTFHNNLGWVLLKLAEWGVEELKPEDGIPPELVGNPAVNAEKYFRNSLSLNDRNKLTHANLCLLYAAPWYRKQKGETYLDRCRYHGRMAIRLDPGYINGHRDLALSLVRYGAFDEGYRYFEKALELALVVEKDQEIIADAVKVLEEVHAGDQELERWRHPDPRLLEPPDSDGATPSPGKAGV